MHSTEVNPTECGVGFFSPPPTFLSFLPHGTQNRILLCMHAHTRATRAHTNMHTCMHTPTHERAHTYEYARMCTRVRTCAHARMRRLTPKHAHTHECMHMCSQLCLVALSAVAVGLLLTRVSGHMAVLLCLLLLVSTPHQLFSPPVPQPQRLLAVLCFQLVPLKSILLLEGTRPPTSSSSLPLLLQ